MPLALRRVALGQSLRTPCAFKNLEGLAEPFIVASIQTGPEQLLAEFNSSEASPALADAGRETRGQPEVLTTAGLQAYTRLARIPTCFLHY